MAGFPPSVFAVAIERDVIVLDTVADRYLALPGSLIAKEAGCRTGTDEGLLPEAAIALREAGLLGIGPGRSDFLTLAKPVRAHVLPVVPVRSVNIADVVRFAGAVTITAWKLREGVGCRTFERYRRTGDAIVPADLAAALRGLHETRLIVPSPRRCLPASLIAARFLRWHGHEVEIVFGVRSHPFAAHCWIEAGGMVLDDDLDRVRAFTPIAVGRL